MKMRKCESAMVLPRVGVCVGSGGNARIAGFRTR